MYISGIHLYVDISARRSKKTRRPHQQHILGYLRAKRYTGYGSTVSIKECGAQITHHMSSSLSPLPFRWRDFYCYEACHKACVTYMTLSYLPGANTYFPLLIPHTTRSHGIMKEIVPRSQAPSRVMRWNMDMLCHIRDTHSIRHALAAGHTMVPVPTREREVFHPFFRQSFPTPFSSSCHLAVSSGIYVVSVTRHTYCLCQYRDITILCHIRELCQYRGIFLLPAPTQSGFSLRVPKSLRSQLLHH